jgi:exodeoxyribonuclease VII large subunit
MIVGRGGGSLEDLWCFNEEVVARAISRAKTPIISAVGHETDFTIADFVADLRAATPTHAAQTIVPDCGELLEWVSLRKQRLAKSMAAQIQRHHVRLLQLAKRLRDPRAVLVEYMQRLDLLSGRLWKWQPSGHLIRAKNRIAQAWDRIDRALLQCQKNAQLKVQSQIDRLEMLSPLKVIARGFSVVEKADGSLVTQISDVVPKDALSIRLKDGYVAVTAESTRRIG